MANFHEAMHELGISDYQIDGLDITNFQKLRLKKLIDTRDPGYSMGESYNRAFKEVKKRVKDNKLNFAIDVSGYAG